MSEQEETEMLLPWYSIGKLSPEDEARVEKYLAENPEARLQLDLISEERDATISVNESINTPLAGSIDRLMTRLDVEFGAAPSASKSTGWLQSVWSDILSAFQMPAMRYAGIAAALLIAVQFASILSLVNQSGPPSGFETASGESATLGGTVLLVEFNKDATVAQISNLLEETDGSIIEGPAGSGIYRVQFNIEDVTETKVQALIKSLTSHSDIIGFVMLNE